MGGRQAQIKVNKCWGGTKISRHMPDCCNEVCAELSPCMLPVHYHHYHPGCLHSHRGNQPRSSVIKRIHCALHKRSQWTIYKLHAKRLSSSADPIISPAMLLPVWIIWEKTPGVSVLMVSICRYKNTQTFWKQTRQWRWNGKRLQRNSARTICGGDSGSETTVSVTLLLWPLNVRGKCEVTSNLHVFLTTINVSISFI